jgi:arginase
LATKTIRQADQLALVGAPTSAAAAAAGAERAPEALRKAGLADRLRVAGYQVTDFGDACPQVFQADLENPRARNLAGVLAMLEALRPRMEQAIRARALPIVLGGDASVAIALAAGMRRLAPSLGFVHLSRHAALHTPTQTEDGLIEPMVVSHLVGQGAAELLSHCNVTPLVREPDLMLFGLEAPEALEDERLGRLAIGRFSVAEIRRRGVRAAAGAALEMLRARTRDYVVHLGLDSVAGGEVAASDRGQPAGLSVAELREAMTCFATQLRFAGLAISGYNPALDSTGRGATMAVECIVAALAARLEALRRSGPQAAAAEASVAVEPFQAESGGGESIKSGNGSPSP